MKKKILMILLVCVVLSICAISVYAIVDACSHSGGYSTKYIEETHIQLGQGCRCTEQLYCPKCKLVFDTYEITYTQCPH